MVYVAGFIGFVFGFLVGQAVLLMLLRGRSKKEILENKQIHWTYGLLNWVIAGTGAYIFAFGYQYFFLN